MTKYLAIAILITGFLVGDAYGEDRIADVYFDDGSVLHNAKFIPYDYSDEITVKYQNEFFALPFSDIKTIEFVVKPGEMGLGGRMVLVTLKIKTKTDVVVNDQFLPTFTNYNIRGAGYCKARSFSIVNKLTGKEVSKHYPITNLTKKFNLMDHAYCVFKERDTKAIKSIVFKD
jgi:hypothetical protein